MNVRVEVLSPVGWLAGNLSHPTERSLHRWLEEGPDFVSLTEVQMGAGQQAMRHLALHRSAITLLTVRDPAWSPAPVPDAIEHRVSCLLEDGVVRGGLSLTPGARLSDYLRGHRTFLPFTDCELVVRGSRGTDPGDRYHFTAALVGAARIIGVAEAERLFS